MKTRHQVSSSATQCSHCDPQMDPATNATQAGEGGRDPHEVPHHPSPIEMLPTRPRSAQRPRRQKQMALKHGVPQPTSGLCQHDVVAGTQGLRVHGQTAMLRHVHTACRRGMAFCRSPMQKSLGSRLARGARQGPENLMGQRGKPFAGSSLSSNTPQGRETAACLGKDRRSAGFGTLLRPAHLTVLMQLSISRSHAEAEQLQMPGARRQSGTAAPTAQQQRRFLRSHCTACQPVSIPWAWAESRDTCHCRMRTRSDECSSRPLWLL